MRDCLGIQWLLPVSRLRQPLQGAPPRRVCQKRRVVDEQTGVFAVFLRSLLLPFLFLDSCLVPFLFPDVKPILTAISRVEGPCRNRQVRTARNAQGVHEVIVAHTLRGVYLRSFTGENGRTDHFTDHLDSHRACSCSVLTQQIYYS